MYRKLWSFARDYDPESAVRKIVSPDPLGADGSEDPDQGLASGQGSIDSLMPAMNGAPRDASEAMAQEPAKRTSASNPQLRRLFQIADTHNPPAHAEGLGRPGSRAEWKGDQPLPPNATGDISQPATSIEAGGPSSPQGPDSLSLKKLFELPQAPSYEVPEKLARERYSPANAREMYGEIETLRNADQAPLVDAARHQKNFVQRFGSGAKKAYHNFEPGPNSGGLFGLGAALLGGGLDSGFDPKSDAEKTKQAAIEKLWGPFTQQATAEKVLSELDLTRARTAESQAKPEQFNIAQQNKFKLEQQHFQHNMELADLKAAAEGNKWKRVFHSNGTVWKQYNDGRLEPLMNPEDPTQQEVDPGHKYYEVISPITGQRIQVTGRELYAGESQVEAGNVTATNKTNDAEYKYQQDLADIDGRIAAAQKRKVDTNARLAQIGKLTGIEKLKAVAEAEKLQKEIREEESELAGLEARKKALPKPPVAVSRSSADPKATSKAQVEAYAKQSGITYEEALKRAQSEGFTVK